MRALRRRLSYANVVATLALFLSLSGGVVWAAGRIGTNRLKPRSVTAAKIKRNAVTAAKIRARAVTAAKIHAGAVDFEKLARGSSLLGTAGGGPAAAAGAESPLVTIPLSGTISFAPASGAVDFLSVEARGDGLAATSPEGECTPTVIPFVNGSPWRAGGDLDVRSFTPTPDRPTGLSPIAGESGPIGLTTPGTSQTVAVKLRPDPDCAPGGTVSVAIAVTQAK